jgi:Tfp pilus assembly protein PilN
MTPINLIPSHLLFARARGRRLRIWGISAAAAIALVAIPCVLDQVRAAQADSLREELHVLSSEEASLRDQLAETAREAKHLANQTERAKALRSKRAWSKMLALLGACLPDQAWYTSIATDPAFPVGGRSTSRVSMANAAPGQPGDKAPKTITIDAPRRLALSGFALEYEQVYELMGHLKATGVFTNIELLQTVVDANRDVPAVRFELVCDW